MKSKLARAETQLVKAALKYPGAYEDFPWGERVIKVAKKIFLFIGMIEDGQFRVAMKLPESAEAALCLPFAERTGYNLGNSGWITAKFGKADDPPVGILQDWIDESYRAVAPKKLVAELEN